MNISEFYVIRFRKAQKKMRPKLVKGSQQNEKIVACIIRFLRANFNSVATFFALLMYFRKKFAFCSEFRGNWVDANTFDSATFMLLGIKHRLRLLTRNIFFAEFASKFAGNCAKTCFQWKPLLTILLKN